jgi:beta-N-acetylhexosaminidase
MRKKRLRKSRVIMMIVLFVFVFSGAVVALIFLRPQQNNNHDSSRLPDSSSARPSSSSSRQATPARPSLPELSLEDQVGQLIMVGMTADSLNQTTLDAITTYHIGSVIMTGRSNLDIASTRKLTDDLQRRSLENVKLFISADQEGGFVQVFQGEGFSRIPDGITQGSWTVSELQNSAKTWGNELTQAGINFDLAPVADLVSSESFAPQNAPIGYWGREYSFDKNVIESHATAFYRGMFSAKVLSTAKHFPGLGRVTGNTDLTANVRDGETTASNDSIQVFQKLIDEGIPSIMTATAIYDQIDPSLPAAFSRKVVQNLLRQQLAFKGLVLTDDLSDAAQVQAWTVSDRAVLSISAGNDMVLFGNPDQAAEVYSALLQKAKEDEDFAALVKKASMRVLTAKQSLGLLISD